jgi:hypothetical protein
MLRAELRGTKCYVAFGVTRRGRLFLLGSAGKAVAHGKLIKRPLVLGDGFALIGFREDEWREALDSS